MHIKHIKHIKQIKQRKQITNISRKTKDKNINKRIKLYQDQKHKKIHVIG